MYLNRIDSNDDLLAQWVTRQTYDTDIAGLIRDRGAIMQTYFCGCYEVALCYPITEGTCYSNADQNVTSTDLGNFEKCKRHTDNKEIMNWQFHDIVKHWPHMYCNSAASNWRSYAMSYQAAD